MHINPGPDYHVILFEWYCLSDSWITLHHVHKITNCVMNRKPSPELPSLIDRLIDKFFCYFSKSLKMTSLIGWRQVQFTGRCHPRRSAVDWHSPYAHQGLLSGLSQETYVHHQTLPSIQRHVQQFEQRPLGSYSCALPSTHPSRLRWR